MRKTLLVLGAAIALLGVQEKTHEERIATLELRLGETRSALVRVMDGSSENMLATMGAIKRIRARISQQEADISAVIRIQTTIAETQAKIASQVVKLSLPK